MSLAPLLDAAPAIRLHALGALLALPLGVWQLARRKGTPGHRVLGWIWVALMVLVAGTSFRIHTLCSWHGFSLIHLLSVFTLLMLPLAVWRAHRHDIRGHRLSMIGMFVGALVIAGLFTLLPGRIMHDVVTGQSSSHGSCS